MQKKGPDTYPKELAKGIKQSQRWSLHELWSRTRQAAHITGQAIWSNVQSQTVSYGSEPHADQKIDGLNHV